MILFQQQGVPKCFHTSSDQKGKRVVWERIWDFHHHQDDEMTTLGIGTLIAACDHALGYGDPWIGGIDSEIRRSPVDKTGSFS